MIFGYFVSPDHQNSIFCVELLPKINLIYAKQFARPLAHGVSDLLSAGLFVKLSFDIVSPGSQGPRQRPRRAGAGLPRWTSRTLGRPWDPPFGSADTYLVRKNSSIPIT